MEKKEKILLGIAYVLVFLIAVYADVQGGNLAESEVIYREEIGGESVDVDLIVNVEDVLKDYDVSIEVEPRQVTEEEAERYFTNVMEEIEADFSNIQNQIPMKDSYENGVVEAEWSFSPAGIIGAGGEISTEEVPEEGVLVTANVILHCGMYETVYRFPFRLEKPEMTAQEQVEMELSAWIANEQEQEGTNTFQLPKELAGYAVEWSEKKEFLSLKILFLEGVSVVLLIVAKRKEREEEEKKQRRQRELLYPELLNQLLILLEAGMTTRQAWHRIAYQYKEKQKKQLVEDSEVYAAVLQLDRRLSEGENEKTAYESFAKQMDSMCYRRLVRLLVNNLEKGSKDICQQLGLEAKQAYDQRILLAKKLGEEASTKMLIPMMLMMVLVMVIVMAPAIMGFSL